MSKQSAEQVREDGFKGNPATAATVPGPKNKGDEPKPIKNGSK